MPFTIPDSLDLDQELTTSFGIYHADAESVHVKLQFSRRVARYVAEYRWHPSQQTTPQYDGSLTDGKHSPKVWDCNASHLKNPGELKVTATKFDKSRLTG